MKLILTEAEKKANTWLELDDESVGKVVKATALKMKDIATEQQKIYHLAAAMVLVGSAIETNANRLTNTLENLTIKGEKQGDWKVTIEKINLPPSGS